MMISNTNNSNGMVTASIPWAALLPRSQSLSKLTHMGVLSFIHEVGDPGHW